MTCASVFAKFFIHRHTLAKTSRCDSPFSCVPRDEFLKLGVHQTTSSLRRKMCPKLRPSAVRVGNVQEAIQAVRLNTRAQKPPCSFFSRSYLPMPLLCKMAPPPSLVTQHEASRHGLIQYRRTGNGQRLAPSRGQIHLSTNTRIMQPSPLCRVNASRNAPLF